MPTSAPNQPTRVSGHPMNRLAHSNRDGETCGAAVRTVGGRRRSKKDWRSEARRDSDKNRLQFLPLPTTQIGYGGGHATCEIQVVRDGSKRIQRIVACCCNLEMQLRSKACRHQTTMPSRESHLVVLHAPNVRGDAGCSLFGIIRTEHDHRCRDTRRTTLATTRKTE